MLTLLSLLTTAQASGNYPAEVATFTEAPCTPTCLLCHTTASGGGGTANQAFAVALTDRGLTGGGDVDALTTALSALEADAVDSDGEGTTDIEGLRAGLDPNDGSAFCGSDVAEAPTYGCFQHARAGSGLGLVVGALAAAWLRRR